MKWEKHMGIGACAIALVGASIIVWPGDQSDGGVTEEITIERSDGPVLRKAELPLPAHREDIPAISQPVPSDTPEINDAPPKEDRSEQYRRATRAEAREIFFRESIERRSRFDVDRTQLSDAAKITLSELLRPVEDQLVEVRLRRKKIQNNCMQEKVTAGLYLKGEQPEQPPGAIISGFRALPNREIVFVSIRPGEFPELDAVCRQEEEVLHHRSDILRSFDVTVSARRRERGTPKDTRRRER